LQLETSGVNFYDVVDTSAVTAYSRLQKMRMVSDSSGTLYFYFRQAVPTDTLSPYGAALGIVTQPLAGQLLLMRGRIRNVTFRNLSMQARIGTIGHLLMRAAIFARKTVDLSSLFYVRNDMRQSLHMEFYAGNGIAMPWELLCRARIEKAAEAQFVGHFIVYNTQTPPLSFKITSKVSMRQHLQIRAYVIKP